MIEHYVPVQPDHVLAVEPRQPSEEALRGVGRVVVVVVHIREIRELLHDQFLLVTNDNIDVVQP